VRRGEAPTADTAQNEHGKRAQTSSSA
jgi:hypothetical protein